jgi:hypothetical protein
MAILTAGTDISQFTEPNNWQWAVPLREMQYENRSFAADVLACIHCGGRLRILATIRAPEITRKILDHLGIPSRPPPVATAILQEPPFAFE